MMAFTDGHQDGGTIGVEKVGEGILITFSSGATVHFSDMADAVQVAMSILQIVAFGTQNGVLDALDEDGVFGHEGPRP